MPNDFKRLDCVEFHERFGRNHRPNEYGEVYERSVAETLANSEEREKVTTQTNEALGGNLPPLNLEDPANLEAFYGNFAFFDHYRKSVLSQCWELLRAQYAQKQEKVTEARLENEARNHPLYLDFLAIHFLGRQRREQNVFDSLRGGL